MNHKISVACLILIVAPLFSAFRGPVVKVNENTVEPGATNLILQSKDGGQTWQDISNSLPEYEQPEDLFAGESDLYLRVNNLMYHSKSNLKTPVWEKENVLGGSIAFNLSGATAYNYNGQIYQKKPDTGTWLPVYTNFKTQSLRSVFETSEGTVLAGCDYGLYKSTDMGGNWKRVFDKGWVIDLVESNGVLIATSQSGIIRSTDDGENWEVVISDGGVGIDVESIDGGFAAISYSTSTESRRIRISLDKGKTWKDIDEGLRPSSSISSIKQMGRYLICGHPDGIFRSSDMGKTWDIVQVSNTFSLTGFRSAGAGKVFKICRSGNVLYAVSVNAGC